jgi:hypothetical protein
MSLMGGAPAYPGADGDDTEDDDDTAIDDPRHDEPGTDPNRENDAADQAAGWDWRSGW